TARSRKNSRLGSKRVRPLLQAALAGTLPHAEGARGRDARRARCDDPGDAARRDRREVRPPAHAVDAAGVASRRALSRSHEARRKRWIESIACTSRSTRAHGHDQRSSLATTKHDCRWRAATKRLEAKLAEKDAQLAAVSARLDQIEHKMALANKQLLGP